MRDILFADSPYNILVRYKVTKRHQIFKCKCPLDGLATNVSGFKQYFEKSNKIYRILWNLMKSIEFYEIHRIRWNPPKLIESYGII